MLTTETQRLHQLESNVIQAILKQHQDRHFWHDNVTSEGLCEAIQQELVELHEAVEAGLPAVAVLAEMADIEYFSVCHHNVFGDLPKETAAIRDQIWLLAQETGVDMNQAVAMKILRNGVKYPASQLDGSGSIPRIKNLKDAWDLNGGDERFYQWFCRQDFSQPSPTLELEWKKLGGDFDEIIWVLPLLRDYLVS